MVAALDPEIKRLRKLTDGGLADEAGSLKARLEVIKDEAVRRGLKRAEGELWKLSLTAPGVSNRTDKAGLLRVLRVRARGA
jgi:hypothetical protein